MRTRFLVPVVLCIAFCSCEESFNPKTEFQEKYGLFAVVENYPPTYNQGVTAVVVKTFDTDGFNPDHNHHDNSIPGCKVTILFDDNEVKLSEYQGSNMLGYQPVNSYLGGFKAAREQEIKIKAELPNGKILTSSTTVPGMIEHLDFSYPFNSGVHTDIDRFAWGEKWRIEWDSYNDDMYFPKLSLNYTKKDDNGNRNYTKEIPMEYAKIKGKFEAVYPSPTWNKCVEYCFDCIDSAMADISMGDSLKENYVIQGITFSIIEFERNLASYYSSTNGYLDNFSIRLDETVYSNVSGGIGVFGACTMTSQTFDVNTRYAQSFGYSVR